MGIDGTGSSLSGGIREGRTTNVRRLAIVSLVIMVSCLIAAPVTKLWFLTAAPIGFLLGFFLEKGGLCGAAAFSEVIVLRDGRKLFGLWIAILTTMAVFSLGVLAGMPVFPRPLLWGLDILGGLVFGVGMVLAGGCVSGCLFKGATGNLNSLSALVGIPIGMYLVRGGPLQFVWDTLKATSFEASREKGITLSTLTGLPPWAFVLLLGGATLLWARRGRRSSPPMGESETGSSPSPPVGESDEEPCSPLPVGVPEGGGRLRRLLTRPWKPWHAGLAIGLLSIPGLASGALSGRGYPLCVSNGVFNLANLLTERKLRVFQISFAHMKAVRQEMQAAIQAGDLRSWVSPWLMVLVLALCAGAWVSGRMSGHARLLPKPPEQTIIAFFGGILVGIGVALANGCVIGHVVSGIGLLSVGSLVFGVSALLGNWITSYLYLLGGPSGGS